jgi:hypothetical protein
MIIFVQFYMIESNSSLDAVIKSDSIHTNFVRPPFYCFIFYRRTQRTSQVSSKICIHNVRNQYRVTPTSIVTTDILLIVLVVGNYKCRGIEHIVIVCSYQV